MAGDAQGAVEERGAAGTTTNFTYAGLRNDERTTAGSTSFLNGSLGITQQTKTSGTTSFIRDPEGTLISMRNNAGASYYYTTDALGSVILLTDSTQTAAATYAYDSWGNTTSTGTQAAANPWTYAGGYKDTTTGYTKFGARYYNAGIGRFSQPDPSGQEQNRYAYAECNPINNSDPSGLFWDQCTVFTFASIGAGIISLASGATAFVAAGTIFGLPAGGVLGAYSLVTGALSLSLAITAASVC